MIEGYSVKDAADILGIPKRRVWELIARGVLASSPEGPAGVRVYLQPTAAQQSEPPAVAITDPPLGKTDEPDPPRHNGNGGGTGEMSPFRELLTEFRSLTERYGQALLALGEARGEVAALRTRVELLEARMDLRLPSTRPASTVAWEISDLVSEPATALAEEPEFEPELEAAQAAAAVEAAPGPVEPEVVEPVEPTAEAVFLVEPEEREAPLDTAQQRPTEDVAPVPVDVEPEARVIGEGEIPEEAEPEPSLTDASTAVEPELPAESTKERREPKLRRSRSRRTALAGFAQALARADDPTIAELPGAEEAAQALAALRTEMEASREAAPAAETAAAEPVADEAVPEPAARDMSPYSTEIVEPDWFADGDFAWLEAPEASAHVADVDTVAADAQAAAAEVKADSAVVIEPSAVELPVAEAAVGELAEGTAVAEVPPPEIAAEPELPVEAVTIEPFEPSAEAQTIAEEEARAAIQDAFEEPAAVTRDAVFEEQPDLSAPAPGPEAEAIQEAFSEVAAPPAWPEADSAAPEEEAQFEGEAEARAAPAAAEPIPEPEPEPEPQPESEPISFDQHVVTEEFAQVDVATPPEEFVAPATFETWAPSVQPETTEAAHEAVTPAGEEELMWLGDEFEEASLEVASQGWRSAGSAGTAAPVLELSDAELSQLAEDEGWDMAEVEAIRSLLGRTPEVSPEVEEAGIDEPAASAGPPTREAPLAEPPLDESPRDDPPPDESRAKAEPEPESAAAESAEPATALQNAEPPSVSPPNDAVDPSTDAVDPAYQSAEAPVENPDPPAVSMPSRPVAPPQRMSVPPTADPLWLKGRRGPAATAYRRLRRLFPS